MSMSPCDEENGAIEPENIRSTYRRKGAIASHPPRRLADLEEVRTYGHKAERAAALIYAHFKKEFGLPVER